MKDNFFEKYVSRCLSGSLLVPRQQQMQLQSNAPSPFPAPYFMSSTRKRNSFVASWHALVLEQSGLQ